MQLFIRGGIELLSLDLENKDITLKDIKEIIAVEYGVETVDDILLSFSGIPLNDDDKQLVTVGLVQGATIDASVKLLGGKIHGQLSRAGKVKSATPKVEKQEDKPKKLTGRAKQRQLYTKRFVNKITTIDGRQCGPNSNQA
ncbi:unnamed protein product [Didymodactylos carnosus]|uniref:Ubiquitin-like domain-containing protein n=2 Tax=Didymodactylos carnosus TaxID=1234261 RepID=A0A813Z184_9BILA|nr:unnamed protein product [Didymodactylos carnosus]CAF0891968.1 unnamed protein product [Didymodactylos carnosus]CAF3676044.1 unnamed protein product [Didymodactylos carnosus]CAF3676058.1 unnamed protein product [Didymodactylos carnosus]